MLLQNYLHASRSLAKLSSLSDIRDSTANEHIVSSLLDITCDSDSTVDQIYIAALVLVAPSNPLVQIQGGTLPKTSEIAGTKVGDFQIGMFPVTYEEWHGVRNWAVENGFDTKVGMTGGPKHPVGGRTWYDCVKWCNAKSLMEGLEPVYGLKGQEGHYSCGELGTEASEDIVWRPHSNGYRLPTVAEWEWAARGGRNSQGYTFAGSNNLNDVGWYSDNSGRESHAVGEKASNELGLYDMSGNVWEWCWDHDSWEYVYRRNCGGSWMNTSNLCALGKSSHAGNLPGASWECDIGFRLARSL